MKVTLSVIKADVGSLAGHVKPSQKLMEAVENHVKNNSKGLLIDYDISSEKATEIRRQGFVGAAMLPYTELEYGGIVDKLNKIDSKFKVRK